MDIKRLKEEVETFLKQYFESKGSYNKKIYEAMSYSINLGGKRIRPILMLLVYNMYNKDYKEILPVAAAIEMIHTYSLIHDDLPCMDNDDFRRGKPSNHKVFGEAIAVLAGDALLNEAVSIMFSYCLQRGYKELKACSIIADSAGAEGMIGGQVVDILSEGKSISSDELTYMHSKKTGALITASILAGAFLAEVPENDIKLLKEYGEKLGLTFQIRDDILNVIGNKELLGKSVNSDLENEKTNFITAYGLEKCKVMCESLTKECISLLKELGRNTDSLQELTMFLLERQF
ncbi:polyprenyl synthetase family protein [Clostridium sp. SYSU_GA19001]|uniref:polyprenyl synthetase family protein n=1 Tax=Clostridium caldaquaticum TaxID=2940653 RepID=UPI00207783FA|nr:farnesyl diphosphate synthase [Clostridium caldaquaticum]MCM8711049.1 polyprenyl synthetase family protein [Clostridium caldaquaticum]